MLSNDFDVRFDGQLSLFAQSRIEMRMRKVGDCALLVSFGERVDRRGQDAVQALDADLRHDALAGIVDIVPSYASLLIEFDPSLTDASAVADLVDVLWHRPCAGRIEAGERNWRIPVAYGNRYGPDIEDVAARLGMTVGALIEAHAGAHYTVAVLGFLPGFAYLSGLPPHLAMPRRASPRPDTPTGIIAIGGAQTAVGSVAGPSGWNIIGRTPELTFRPGRDAPSLLQVGDRVRFVPIPDREFDKLHKLALDGAVVAECVDVVAS